MIKIDAPKISYAQSLQACKDGIVQEQDLKNKLNLAHNELINQENNYIVCAKAGNLYTFPKALAGDPEVATGLKKSNFTKLYDYYLVQRPSGRKVYDELMAAAERCPFCGWIGQTGNLDHYLPKKHFPQFSILPSNLIPACSLCNMGDKGQSIATSAEKQVLHPYLDKNHFFDEQWIFAKYIISTDGEPSYAEYYPDPPSTWSSVDKKRAQQHFQSFDLAKKYATESSTAITEVNEQAKAFLQLNISDFKEAVLQPVINSAPFPNYWKRVLYQAIAKTISQQF